ncbi:MAG: leucine-rich repeat protein [Prevotella sp.]|nr:leucine-rich repeat protein [Prevotella sp.]
MKKRGLSFCILFLSTMVYAQETGSVLKVAIDGLTYKLNQGTHTAMVANANSWEGELDIPEQVAYNDETYIVDKLEWLAFDLCKTLTKVRIPKTVVKIQHYANYEECKNPFRNCTSLESIEVDEANPSMCSVNGVLFSKDKTQLYCYPAGAKRETYSVPDGVKWLCAEAFAFNSYLTSINMPNSVTNMCFGTFCCCKSLNSIRLSENIKRISAWTFEKCESLHFLDIPESVMSFEERVFSWSPIKTIVIRGTFPEGLRNDTFYFIDDEVIIYVQPSEIEKFKKVFKGTVLPLSDWAQDNYRPFVEEGKVWKVGDDSGNPVKRVEYYYFDGDTIIDGKTYKQMMCQRYVSPDHPDYAVISRLPSLSKVGAWYEEDMKVYFYNTTNKQLKMMYDFSLEANDTLLIDNLYPYVIGPKQTGGLDGFKGVYRDIMWCRDGESNYYCTTWLEGVGGIDGPTFNIYYGEEGHAQFLMSCTVGDEVIYLNDEYEDGATPDDMEAKKHRFDFTHTVKTQPRMPTKRVEEAQSLYGEYSNLRLGINLDPLDAVYQVRITNESGKVVYEKAINAGSIVALDIDISTYAEGRYTVTVENSHETFSGEFEMQTTGIEEVRNKHELVSGYIYNLQGQRISSLRKGLNIVNGKKIFVK